MKRALYFSIGLFVLSQTPWAFALGKCGGFDPCPACKSCATCGFCTKDKGTCGACKNKDKSTPAEKPKKEVPPPKPSQE